MNDPEERESLGSVSLSIMSNTTTESSFGVSSIEPLLNSSNNPHPNHKNTPQQDQEQLSSSTLTVREQSSVNDSNQTVKGPVRLETDSVPEATINQSLSKPIRSIDNDGRSNKEQISGDPIIAGVLESSSVSVEQSAINPAEDKLGDTECQDSENVLDSDHYVTVIQDGQTYAIPLADYESMLAKSESLAPENLNKTTPFNPVEEKATAENGLGMRWLSAGAFESTPKRKIVPNPTLPKATKKTPLRPIKVDNWGIFLLNRLQNCFQRKELCDLTIRFPDLNAQIKVHKLVVNACTEYFISAEKSGKLVDGTMDMPANFLPDAMAPIIRFMYTGKLELREDSFQKLYDTASLLNMSVLTKLMDTQISRPMDMQKKAKRKHYSEEQDPITQAKKFKKMEEIVRQEEAKAMKIEKLKTIYKLKKEKEDLDKQKMPGKKLPIWKKRIVGGEGARIVGLETSDSLKSANQPLEQNITDISSKPSPSLPYRIPKLEKKHGTDDVDITHSRPIVVQSTYQRKTSPDKPKIPRKLREIQEHLMFEKILRTGSKNTVMTKEQEEFRDKSDPSNLSAEEIKELGQEQAERKNMGEEDDYFDDVEYVNDEYIENIESPAPTQQDDQVPKASLDSEKQATDPSIDSDQTSLAIVKPEANDPTRKTMMFNMKPDPYKVEPFDSSKEPESILSTTNEQTEHNDHLDNELDTALEEFSRVAEEEALELEHGNNEHSNVIKKPRRGRPPRWLQEKTLNMVEQKDPSESAANIIDVSSSQKSNDEDQSKVIGEILKKYPNILKENKSVKIKLSVIENGKPAVQVITLKPQMPNNLNKSESVEREPRLQFTPSTGLRAIPKVLYTGRRGRPKKLKEGETDPHAEERKKIKEKLLKTCPSLARQIGDDIVEQHPTNLNTTAITTLAGSVINSKSEIKQLSLLSPSHQQAITAQAATGSIHMDYDQASQQLPAGTISMVHTADRPDYHKINATTTSTAHTGLVQLQLTNTANQSHLQFQQEKVSQQHQPIRLEDQEQPAPAGTGGLEFSTTGSILVDSAGTQFIVPNHGQDYIQIIENPEDPKYVYVMDLKADNLIVPTSMNIGNAGAVNSLTTASPLQLMPPPPHQHNSTGATYMPVAALPDNSGGSMVHAHNFGTTASPIAPIITEVNTTETTTGGITNASVVIHEALPNSPIVIPPVVMTTVMPSAVTVHTSDILQAAVSSNDTDNSGNNVLSSQGHIQSTNTLPTTVKTDTPSMATMPIHIVPVTLQSTPPNISRVHSLSHSTSLVATAGSSQSTSYLSRIELNGNTVSSAADREVDKIVDEWNSDDE